jgi:Uma2 family endonuclease
MGVTTVESIPLKTITPPAEIFLPDDNNFPYGWRQIAEALPDGRIAYRRVPLTPEDFLDPQLGDRMPQGDPHARLSIAIFDMLNNYYLDNPHIGVFFDLKMKWGIPGLKEPAPDVSIIPHLRHKKAKRQSFNVNQEKTRPCLVIEVMSPGYDGDDTTKVDIYRQAGIAEYIIINPHSDAENAPFTLQGYRLAGKVYQEIRPDAKGRLLSETTGIYFGLNKNRRRVILTGAATGQRLLTATEEKAARELAELRAAQAIEVRELAESQVAQEVAARQMAESRAAEAESRAAEAEAKAAQEAAARQALEEELAQLRAQQPPRRQS